MGHTHALPGGQGKRIPLCPGAAEKALGANELVDTTYIENPTIANHLHWTHTYKTLFFSKQHRPDSFPKWPSIWAVIYRKTVGNWLSCVCRGIDVGSV